MHVTDDEIKTAAGILGKLDPGILPSELFLQYTRLVVVPTVEFVPLRTYDGNVQVLLLEREQDDIMWAGKVHVPGTVIRATDSKGSFATAFERILNGELKGQKVHGEIQFMKHLFHQVKRGPEIAFIHWGEMLDEPLAGNFYNVSDLPEHLVEHQRDFIKEAAEAFRSQK